MKPNALDEGAQAALADMPWALIDRYYSNQPICPAPACSSNEALLWPWMADGQSTAVLVCRACGTRSKAARYVEARP